MPSTPMPAGTNRFSMRACGSIAIAAKTMNQPEISRKMPVILISVFYVTLVAASA